MPVPGGTFGNGNGNGNVYGPKIDLSEYDFNLPPDRIAQVPAARREESRLLVLDRSRPDLHLARFREIGRFLREGDLLVLNDTRVFPARLRCLRPSGAELEVLLLSPAGEHPFRWRALLRPARSARRGASFPLAESPGCSVRAIQEEEGGRFQIELSRDGSPLHPDEVMALCEKSGEMPLPPYIRREARDPRRLLDRERYQTVYARVPGAAAAPTAGLHFSEGLLESLQGRGIETARVTLTVGLGTFQPLREQNLITGRLHAEAVEIPAGAGARMLKAREGGRRIVAVGTTAARALESWALAGTPIPDSPSWKTTTELFITPGFRFALVDALVTNFHLPRSSLMLLVSALAGRERILEAYGRAMAEGFRFYSYGDAMLIL